MAAGLAARLRPFVDGAFSGLFDGPTTTTPVGHLVVWSLRALPEELKTIGTLLTLDAIWQRVSDPALRRPRMVVVDEAWLLMREPTGAAFLLRAAKAGRKHWAGLTVATQDTADLLGCELGKAVVANAATQILLRQAPQAIDEVTAAFGLSAGERAFLLSAEQGDALLCAGAHRAAFRAIASPVEHALVTTTRSSWHLDQICRRTPGMSSCPTSPTTQGSWNREHATAPLQRATGQFAPLPGAFLVVGRVAARFRPCRRCRVPRASA